MIPRTQASRRGVRPPRNTGVARLVPSWFATKVPGEAGRQAAAFAASPRTARTTRDEVAAYRRAFDQAQVLTSLGARPLVVVTASDTLAGTAGWSDA